jgi:Carboxypeptidase regulatory-like domain
MKTMAVFLGVAVTAFCQSDRGTITGTISDPAGAVVASAPVQVKNIETGAVYQAATSTTGNYTLAQIPAGSYELSVTVEGFKKFVRQNVVVPVAQTLRIDIALEVGSTSESVTVTEAAPLLKTESGELSHNVSTDQLDNLPVLGIGSDAGSAGIRNPYAALQTIPGADWRPDRSVRINGLPANTQTLRVEGQDSTNGLIYTQSMTQPSVDAIQEFAIQTSNYAAEYGQAGGGFFNVTMKSGTNQLHGSAYDYFVNEALNAGVPYTNDGNGHLLRPRQRRNDYGFTLGGPVYLPKIYNGHDKAFFFFNFEQFRETTITNNVPTTLPTMAYRAGDFSQALTGRNVCPAATPNCDPIGRPIMENTVYDPLTDRVENGQRVRDPFPNNTVPLAEQDPVALAIQSLIPDPTNSGLINNYRASYTNPRHTSIPSVKADYQISARSKISGYWSRTATNTPGNNVLPPPITTARGNDVAANTIRINFDQTITPTMLLHVGVGLLDNRLNQPVPSFDPVKEVGLKGTHADLFPYLGGLNTSQGGTTNLGTGAQVSLVNDKPTANLSLTWVRDNHTFKFGGETIIEGYVADNKTYANGWLLFSPIESGLPSTNGQPLAGGTPGFPYASFLMGRVDNGFIGIPSKSRLGAHSFSFFAQDSWKVTRKLTLDYGLRYDFQTYLKEQYGRIPYFSASTPNPAAGGRLGAVAFDGYGPGYCNCDIAHNYPWAFGPRLGLAYQIESKTVLRAGAGVSYYKTSDNGFNSYSTGSQQIYNAPTYGDPAYLLQDGLPYQISWPNFDPGQVPLPGTIASPSQQIDPHAGRPARIIQWSVGLQRQIGSNLLVEATYVGNVGAYWNSAYIICPNCIDDQILAANGLSRNNPDDLKLLGSPLNSQLAIERGFGGLPYPGFPASGTVAQALRPFPQFSNITNMHWAPDGDSWYNSLQMNATKRLSHGLNFSSSFTWSKAFMMGTESDIATLSPVTVATNDVFNRPQNRYLSGLDQPFLFVFAGTYTTPKLGGSGVLGNKALSWVARDWEIGAVLRYGSGLPIMSPTASNGLRELLFRGTGAIGTGGGTFMNRVAGQPLLLQDLNCHCFDPNTTFVLNPAAWVNPAAGQWGTSAAYYGDYRYQRRPDESMSLARVFRIGERASVQIRAEFTNIFNRAEFNNPVSNNALLTQRRNSAGQTIAGFGYINTGTTFSAPREGTLVARFTF